VNPHYSAWPSSRGPDRPGGLLRVIAGWDREWLSDWRDARTRARPARWTPPPRDPDLWLAWALGTDDGTAPRYIRAQDAEIASRAAERRKPVQSAPLVVVGPWRGHYRQVGERVVAVVHRWGTAWREDELWVWQVYVRELPRSTHRAPRGLARSEDAARALADRCLRGCGCEA
jgi:hypothetical protein